MRKKLWNSTELLFCHHLAPLRSSTSIQKAPFNPKLFRNMETLVVHNPSLIPFTEQQRINVEKSQLEEAFDSAGTSEQMIKAFRDMEQGASSKIDLKLNPEGEDPQKALPFTNIGLKALHKDPNNSSLCLLLMGSRISKSQHSFCSLKRFCDSLGYLDWEDCVLHRSQKADRAESSRTDTDEFFNKGTRAEGEIDTSNWVKEHTTWLNFRTCLEIKETTFEEDCAGKAKRYRDEAYVKVLNLYFEEALAYCLKALKIHEKQLGQDSVELAHVRNLLEIVDIKLQEEEAALGQKNVLVVRKILKNWNLNSDLLQAQIDAAHMMIAKGRQDEAINALKNAIQQTDKDSEV